MKSFLLITSCLFGAYTALACKCAPSILADNFGRSSEVFYGTVTKIQHGSSSNLITLMVDKSWKGSTQGSEKVISTAGSSSMCGSTFEEKQTYLVFANNGNTSICSGNKKGPLIPEIETELTQLSGK
jgi:hypothetical protein